MPATRSATRRHLACLPGAALLHVFQLFCNSSPPDTPGTCYLAPVCKQWRDLACSVKGLKVLFQDRGEEDCEQQRVASMCAWLRRHAHQVVALAVTGPLADAILAALLEAATAAAAAAAAGQVALEDPAAAAAGGGRGLQPLPLRRLVLIEARLLSCPVSEQLLQQVLAALPHLQHLHVPLWASEGQPMTPEQVGEAALAALAPLQVSTSLTSLVLDGPERQQGTGGLIPDAAHVQLLGSLPCGLRSLSWSLYEMQDPRQLSFDRLTGLTRLRLAHPQAHVEPLGPAAFTALKHLRQLELDEIWTSDEGLLACKEQLVALKPQVWTDAVSKLTGLRSLSLTSGGDEEMASIVQQLPALQRYKVGVYNWDMEEEEEEEGELPGWDCPCRIQRHVGMTRLQALELWVGDPMVPPPGLLPLAHLKQLRIEMHDMPEQMAVPWAWSLAGLVNLELLGIPAVLTACWHPWLTTLTRLVVLEVGAVTKLQRYQFVEQPFAVPSAAAHIAGLLETGTGASSCSSSNNNSSAGGPLRRAEQVRVVCFNGKEASRLHRPVMAAVPVLPPGKHLFLGSWKQLQECGVELWPAPVAARLQQLSIV